MFRKFLYKLFHIKDVKQELVGELTKMYYLALDEQLCAKHEWKSRRLAEWSYYKMFWRIEGRISVLRELIKLWE